MPTEYNSGWMDVSCDTFIRNSSASTSYGTEDYVICGQRPSWSQNDVGLMRFDGMPISAAGGTLVPVSATLSMTTYTTANSETSGTMLVGRMTGGFGNTSTWNGVNGYRASQVDASGWSRPAVGSSTSISVLETYRAIVNAGANHGFWLGSDKGGAWRVASSEDNYTGPQLYCTYYILRWYGVRSESVYCYNNTGDFNQYDGNWIGLSVGLNQYTGYTTYFDGWYFNGGIYSYDGAIGFTAGPNFSGTWTTRAHISPNSYTATLDRTGGSGGSGSASVTYDTGLPAISPPSRTGYTFTGYNYNSVQYWNASGAGVRNWNVASNVTLQATWTINSYAITASSGTNISSTSGGGSKVYASSVTIDCVLATATGYTTTFTGWTSSNTGLVANSSSKSYTFNCPAGAVTLTANASKTANTYTITYNGNGNVGGSTANSSHTYDAAKALTANGFTKPGYSFAGWATSAGGAVVYSNSQSVSNLASAQGATVTLYAKWTANTYTATFNPDGGSIVGNNTKAVTYDSAIGILPLANRTGYDFDGWYTEADGAGTKILSSTVFQTVGDVTYYANFVGSGRVWSKVTATQYVGPVQYTWNGTEWVIVD